MGVFRKKETLNEQMLREAGLDRVVFSTPDPLPIEGGVDYTRVVPNWDAATTAVAPAIDADDVRFTVLPDGDLIVESEVGDSDLAPFADAIEEHITPPYMAVASRQDGDVWGVGAKRIEVAEFAYPDAETLELSRRDGVEELRIDDGPTDVAPPPELRQLGEHAGTDFAVEARRIDGNYWEVMVNRL